MFINIFQLFNFFSFFLIKKMKMKIIYQNFHFYKLQNHYPSASQSIAKKPTKLLPFTAPAGCCSHQKKATFNSTKEDLSGKLPSKILET